MCHLNDMPSKILLRNAQILLENHKCKTCPDLLTVLKPHLVSQGGKTVAAHASDTRDIASFLPLT